MSQYTINDSNNCLNTTNSFNSNVWNNCTFADDRSQLLTWLSTLEPSLRHCDIRERRVNHIGEWLIQTEEFRTWCRFGGEGEDDKGVLFCYGDPGVGKTFISSLVVDRLCDQARGQNMVVSCFYFDFAARKEQSATRMLGSLVKQMVNGMERIPGEISRVFQQQKKDIGGCRPQLGDLVKMLQAIASSRPTFICVDALDECDGVQRLIILDSLKEILEKSPGTRIFVTGRPHILAQIESRLAGQVESVSVSPTRGDIARYLHVRLGHDQTPDAMDESLEADILEKITENTSEVFLLVSLNIEAILQESTIYRRRQRLSRMTGGSGLGEAYGVTIERIKAQGGDKSRLGIAALMWISHAERPLSAVELCHALAVELGSKDFNNENVPSMSTLVGCCLGLITVDKGASTVRLIHFTLKEYLSAHHDIFGRPHSEMTEICLTYLNSEQVKAIPADRPPDIDYTPFLKYCSLYWGVHAKRDLSDSAMSLCLELFTEFNDHISGKLLLVDHFNMGPWGFEELYTDSSFTGLHCASLFGICDLVATLTDMGCYDIDEECWGGTRRLRGLRRMDMRKW